jgi:class 3 adenylate cyclase
VIAGEIGSTALGYTVVGEQVGMAQRMESVAPPGAVMLSASTARMVENTVVPFPEPSCPLRVGVLTGEKVQGPGSNVAEPC